MSAHVLLNLLNKLGKRDKMRGLSSILSLFRNKFDKFKNTGARMLDSIYHMILKLFLIHIVHIKMLGFCHKCHLITFPENLCTTSGLQILKIYVPLVGYRF